MNNLRQIQEAMTSYLLHGRSTIATRTLASSSTESTQRLEIYRNAYLGRLTESLKENFGALEAALGDAPFDEAVSAYIAAVPSRHRSIRWYGDSFPTFLAVTPPWKGMPWIADLARFEWTVTLAFDAADEDVVTYPMMTALPPESWCDLRFRFCRSAHLIKLGSNAPAIRSAHDSLSILPDPANSGTPIPWLVWRRDNVVQFRSIGPREIDILLAAMAGVSFPELCTEAVHAFSVEEIGVGIAALVRTWIDEGLIAEAIV